MPIFFTNFWKTIFLLGKLTKEQKFKFTPCIALITAKLLFNFLVNSFLFPYFIRLATLHGHALGAGASRSTLQASTLHAEFLHHEMHLQTCTSPESDHRSRLGVVRRSDCRHALIATFTTNLILLQ